MTTPTTRPKRSVLLRVAATTAVGAAASHASAQPEHARLSVVAEQSSVEPGGTVNLGLVFEIDEHWHLYWPGDNDTGFPVAWEIEGPGEQRAAVWPAPKRHINPGNLLDHVLEGRVTIVVPVLVPADTRPGDTLRWDIDAQWLVCREACVPGDGRGSVEVTVARDTSVNDRARALFEEARARAPKPLNETTRPVRPVFESGQLRIDAPGARAIAFYPLVASREPVDLIAQGTAEGPRLTIALQPGEAPAAGVLEITEPDGSATLAEISVYETESHTAPSARSGAPATNH